MAAGIIRLAPGSGDGARDASTVRTGLIGLVVLSAVIVALVFQSFLAGGGIGQGLLLLVGASLTFITVLAVLNRGRKPPPPASPRR